MTKNVVKKCRQACHLALRAPILQDFSFVVCFEHLSSQKLSHNKYSRLRIHSGKTSMIASFLFFSFLSHATAKESSPRAKHEGLEKKQESRGQEIM
jgi:hypothetical protein